MRKRKKEEQAINPQAFSPNPYKKPVFEKEVLYKEEDQPVVKIEWSGLFEIAQEDLLSSMERFDYPDLKELKKSLLKDGIYPLETINEIISGLATLPGYRD